MEILFVTANDEKFQHVLDEFGKYATLKRGRRKVRDIQGTLDVVAAARAHQCSEQEDYFVCVEISGLKFEALDGMPGPYAAQFLELMGIDKFANMILSLPSQFVTFRTSVSLARWGGNPIVFNSELHGKIVPPQGKGFGWEPIFKPDGFDCVLSQMSLEVKKEILPMYLSFNAMVNYLFDGSLSWDLVEYRPKLNAPPLGFSLSSAFCRGRLDPMQRTIRGENGPITGFEKYKDGMVGTKKLKESDMVATRSIQNPES